MNEVERNNSYDKACRDPKDNCPVEGAVLQREWRQKTENIRILNGLMERQGQTNRELRKALVELYITVRAGLTLTDSARDLRIKVALDAARTILLKLE